MKNKLIKIVDTILKFYNDRIDEFVNKIREGIKNKSFNFYKVVKFLDRAEIKLITKENMKNFNEKRKRIYEHKKAYKFFEIEESLKTLNFKEMENFVYTTSEIEKDYKKKLEKAYAMYYIGKYYEAYKEYKIISEESLKNKEFFIYAVSEFNRHYVGKLAQSEMYCLDKNLSEEIGREVNSIELDKILSRFTFNKNEKEFLNMFINWTFIGTRTQKMLQAKVKINENESNRYSNINGENTGIKQLQNQMKSFWKIIKYNMIAIDRYSDVEEVFYNYIDILLRDYSTPKIRSDEEDSFLGKRFENFKIEKLEVFDLIIMLEYVNVKNLENMFERYSIETIEVLPEDISEFVEVIKNYLVFSNSNKKRFIDISIKKIFLLLSVIKLDKTQYVEMNNYITEISNIEGFDFGYRYLNKYVYYQYERFKNFDEETQVKILCNVLEGFKEDKEANNSELAIVNNISHYIATESLEYTFKNNAIIDNLIKNKQYRILIRLYKIVDISKKEAIRKTLKDKLNEEEYSMKHCMIYYEALMYKVLRPTIRTSKNFEQKYFNYMKKEKEEVEKRKKKGARIYPNYFENMMGFTSNLILNGYIKEQNKFDLFLGIDDGYDFLFNMNDFKPEKFKIEWLNNYSEELIKIIAKNEEIRKEVKKQIKNMPLDKDNSEFDVNKDLIMKYIKYFS